MEYSYRAQLGIGGKGVKIEKTGEASFKVSIPEFAFIGHSDEDFRVAVEDNGILSWTTPDIDSVRQINEILDDDAKRKHIEDNRDILEQQACDFYLGIIHGIDPDVSAEVVFG